MNRVEKAHPAGPFTTRFLLPDAAGIAEAAQMLRSGALVAFGTETVYGLGADATNGRAVAEIFTVKGRPHFNPLICHFPNADAAFAHVVPSPEAARLASAFWPGPLTLVLPRRPESPINLLAGAGLDTLAVRVPAADAALRLLKDAGCPVAAPSANRSGRISPTTAAHVWDELAGRIGAILDCGPARVGLESTVLDLTGPRPVLLRPGAVTAEAIAQICGPVAGAISPADVHARRTLRSPGLLVSHYAPTLPVRLNASHVTHSDGLLAFGPPLPGAGLLFQLSERCDLAEAASRLFDGLRQLDAAGATGHALTGIAVMNVPDQDLGRAINDRLHRAAAPRDPIKT